MSLHFHLLLGCNIGTSITSSLVAFSQVTNKNQFKRSFAGAAVHDLFNILTTIVLLTIEVFAHYLEELTHAMVKHIKKRGIRKAAKVEILKLLTRPLVDRVIKLDQNNCLALTCNSTSFISVKKCKSNDFQCKQTFLFSGTTMNDMEVGGILFVSSLLIICACLLLAVKILNSVLKGHIAVIIKKAVNAKIPYCPWVSGYIFILIGTIVTFLVQVCACTLTNFSSSSVVTSALITMMGFGVINIDVMYPLILGANVGTTTTAILAAFAVDDDNFHIALQASLVHLFFNLTGIVIFYPIPFMRWPIFVAKKLGKLSAEYRWFALVYIIMSFLLIPVIFLGLSFAGDTYVIILFVMLISLTSFIVIINVLQKRRPKCLLRCMRTWNWLPKPLRSLQPYNDFLVKVKYCRKMHEKNVMKRKDTSISHNFGTERGASNISLISFSIDSNKCANSNCNESDILDDGGRRSADKKSLKGSTEK